MFEFIAFSWFLTFGYVPTLSESVNGNYVKLDENQTCTVAELGFSVSAWDRVTFSASMESYQYVRKITQFEPIRSDYKAEIQVRISDRVTVQAQHECDHPISSYPSGRMPYLYNSSETRISMTIKSGTK